MTCLLADCETAQVLDRLVRHLDVVGSGCPERAAVIELELLEITEGSTRVARPGVHRVRVRHPSYEVWEREVTLRAGQTERVVVDFPASGVKKP